MYKKNSKLKNSKQNTTKVDTKVDTTEQNNIDNDIDINCQIVEIDERTRQIEIDALIASSNVYDEPMPEDIAQIMEQFRLLEQEQLQQDLQQPHSLPLHNLKNYDHVPESDINYPYYPDDFNDKHNSYAIDREIKRQQDEDFQACLFADQEREQEQQKAKANGNEIKLKTLQALQAHHEQEQEHQQHQQHQQQVTAVDITPVLLTREELRAQRLKHFNK
uniref:Uncharacterized protein n=1 Tax=viral metagenome TaxID=1070528 RepID=A0A6C0HL07_9ZZZZ